MSKIIFFSFVFGFSIIACGHKSSKPDHTFNESGYIASMSFFDTLANHSSNTIDSNGSIIATAKMQSSRAAHTATLLNNGTVLICGGFSANNSLSSAEIYHPASKLFTQIKNLTTPRSEHSATLLPSGEVLIAGGYNGNYLSTTEIFDPELKSFSKGPNLNSPRSGHTATLLNNGKILFAGGVGPGWSFLSSSELYDIQTKTFSVTGSMTAARESHTATLLNQGTVLITGGHKGRRPDIIIYSNAEIYNPTSEEFTLTGSMTKIRHKHDAVMLKDGNVLIIGGSDERDSRGAYRSAEVYDPASTTFRSVNNMNQSRYKHNGTSILLENGNVLIAGGANRAEIYDLKRKEFLIVPESMKTERLFSCATLLTSGQVLITGGYDENQYVSNNSWIYTYK